MNVQQRDSGEEGAFYVEENGRLLAELSYFWQGDQMIIAHTDVSDELRGQGAGKQLVAAAVAFARDRSITILPFCPFAKQVFERTPTFQDVLG